MTEPLLKIDLHTHILPQDWPNLRERYGYGGFVQLEHGSGCARMHIDGNFFREIQPNSWDPQTRMEECDRHGVQMQVLSTVPIMFSYWAKPEHALDLSRILNDHIASVVREHPTRFAGLGTVPLQSPDLAIQEMERCVNDLGLAGVEIGSHINDKELSDPSLFPFFEAAQELGAAVFVHPWDMVGKERMKPYWLAWLVGMPTETALAISSMIFSGVLERLPQLRICFAHGGGSFPGLIGRIVHGFNVRPDLCAKDNDKSPLNYLKKIYLDTLVHEPETLRGLMQLMGPDRLALGSDYPFPLGEHVPGSMIEAMADLPCAQKAQMLSGTALDFLNIQAPKIEPNSPVAAVAEKPLPYRDDFCLPGPKDKPWIYFCGNSLGLQPKTVKADLNQELKDWAELAVEGHFEAQSPWYDYHEQFRASCARLVGSRTDEVVVMSTLTVNLHLMMVSFYRPTAERFRILIDYPPFPSDLYAVQTQIAHHGFDPKESLLFAKPREGEHYLRLEDIDTILQQHGSEIALVLFNGVSFHSGQFYDMQRITEMGQEHGCKVGWDLAHAMGNVPMKLHDWNVDFAVWCSYKYLNAGPGAVAGCFVHQKHGTNPALHRFAGWWGNDPSTRFRMHLEESFAPREGADGWQLSNPPILSLTPLKASLHLFDQAGIHRLRARSIELTARLEQHLDRMPQDRFEIITPRDPKQRGCQLSLLIKDKPKELQQALQSHGIICDFREPNIIRAAPVPLYTTDEEVDRFAEIFQSLQ